MKLHNRRIWVLAHTVVRPISNFAPFGRSCANLRRKSNWKFNWHTFYINFHSLQRRQYV